MECKKCQITKNLSDFYFRKETDKIDINLINNHKKIVKNYVLLK